MPETTSKTMRINYGAIAAVLVGLLGCGSKAEITGKLVPQDRRVLITRGIEEFVGNYQNVQFVISEQPHESDIQSIVAIDARLRMEAHYTNVLDGTVEFDNEADASRGDQIIVGTLQNNPLIDKMRSTVPLNQPLPPTGTGVIECIVAPRGNLDIIVTGRERPDVSLAAYALANYDRKTSDGVIMRLDAKIVHVEQDQNGQIKVTHKE